MKTLHLSLLLFLLVGGAFAQDPPPQTPFGFCCPTSAFSGPMISV